MESARRRRRREVLALFLVMALTLGYLAEAVSRYRSASSPASGLVEPVPTFLIWEDGVYYRAAIQSMLQDRDLDLRNNFAPLGHQPQSSVALGRHGEWYPKHPILLPLVAAPFYLIAREPGLLAFNIGQLIALGLLMWLCARRLVGDEDQSSFGHRFLLTTVVRSRRHRSPRCARSC